MLAADCVRLDTSPEVARRDDQRRPQLQDEELLDRRDARARGARGDRPVRDYRDLAIEVLADEEAHLRARVADLEADNRTIRELLSAALERLHALTEQNARLRLCLHRNEDVRFPAAR